MLERELDMVVGEASLRFHDSARFDDELALGLTIVRLGTTGMTSRHEIRRDGDETSSRGRCATCSSRRASTPRRRSPTGCARRWRPTSPPDGAAGMTQPSGERCSWCGAAGRTPMTASARSSAEGERRAVFCRLEHVVPWLIRGAHWEPAISPSRRPSSKRSTVARTATASLRAAVLLFRHRGEHRIADGFCEPDHLLEWRRPADAGADQPAPSPARSCRPCRSASGMRLEPLPIHERQVLVEPRLAAARPRAAARRGSTAGRERRCLQLLLDATSGVIPRIPVGSHVRRPPR